MKLTFLAFACALAGASMAQTYVLAGVDDPLIPVKAYDPSNLAAAPIDLSPNVNNAWGMAADDSAQKLYVAQGSTLKTFDYSTWTESNSVLMTVNAAASSFVGLAFNSTTNKLIGIKNVTTEALYEIDPVTGVATTIFTYTSGDYDLGGIEYRASDNLYYTTNDDTTPFGNGIFTIEVQPGGLNIVKIANYPSGETDIDGLALYDGKCYLIEDDASTAAIPGQIYVYDIATATYTGSITTAWPTSEVFSSGAQVTLGQRVTGTVTLGNFGDPTGRKVTIQAWQNNAVVDSELVTLGAGGTYTTSLNATGVVDLRAKSSHWLAQRIASVDITSGATANFSLVNGDVDNNNEVGPNDFAQLSAAFGSELGDPNYNGEADLDGNNEVGPSDFAILTNNFGQEGDE